MNKYTKWVELPLSSIKPGESVIVTGINGNQELTKHLLNIGVAPGNQIKVISGAKNYPFVLDFAGTKVGITWHVSRKIMVKKI
ncbi:MAG TPA: FeoA family protein [Spirochaetota bacterium]|nr:FeoA family protein [Spirochaetota bacterium]HPJ33407.1 FeoA family protein [Spirochaetota bacterium]